MALLCPGEKKPCTVFFIWKFEINILEDDIMNNCLKFLNLGRNHHHCSTIGEIGNPLSLETPMDVSLETPYFHWGPQIFIGDPRFLFDTPYFHWRPPDFQWRPNVFGGDPHYFLKYGGLQREIHGVSNKTQMLIISSQTQNF